MNKDNLISKLMDIQDRCNQVVTGDIQIAAGELALEILAMVKR